MDLPLYYQDIIRILPHRYPFLFVDRIIELELNKRVVGIKNVTINEPFFAGHFPGFPIMPGVLIVEAMAQAGGFLAMHLLGEDVGERKVFFLTIDRARFRKPVVPGDRIELHVEVVKRKGAIWKQKGRAVVDGETVAEADFMAMLVDRKKEG